MSVAPSTATIDIAAEYYTIKVRVLDVAASEKRIPIEAVYQTVSKRSKVSDSSLEWRTILCETNVSPDLISNLQSALKGKGYYSGPIDGI